MILANHSFDFAGYNATHAPTQVVTQKTNENVVIYVLEVQAFIITKLNSYIKKFKFNISLLCFRSNFIMKKLTRTKGKINISIFNI